MKEKISYQKNFPSDSNDCGKTENGHGQSAIKIEVEPERISKYEQRKRFEDLAIRTSYE